MSLTQIMPPASAAFGPNPIKVNGRTYTCAVGAAISVPDWDARLMEGNGWHYVGPMDSTANRPTNLTKAQKNFTFFDSSLNVLIIWDGTQWRNPASGAVV